MTSWCSHVLRAQKLKSSFRFASSDRLSVDSSRVAICKSATILITGESLLLLAGEVGALDVSGMRCCTFTYIATVDKVIHFLSAS